MDSDAEWLSGISYTTMKVCIDWLLQCYNAYLGMGLKGDHIPFELRTKYESYNFTRENVSKLLCELHFLLNLHFYIRNFCRKL